MGDPYREPDVPAQDVANTDPKPYPIHEQPTSAMAALWVPIAIALAFAAGLAYLHYHHPIANPNAHASIGAAT